MVDGKWLDGRDCTSCKHEGKSHDSKPCFMCGRRRSDHYEPKEGQIRLIGGKMVSVD